MAALTITGEAGRITQAEKGIGGGARVRLDRVTLSLSDGSTTTRWELRIHGRSGLSWDNDDPDYLEPQTFTQESAALEAYRDRKFDPDRRASPRPHEPADTCPGLDVRHCWNCGTTVPEPGGWMNASLGTACRLACFDAMSDQRGQHDLRHHS